MHVNVIGINLFRIVFIGTNYCIKYDHLLEWLSLYHAVTDSPLHPVGLAGCLTAVFRVFLACYLFSSVLHLPLSVHIAGSHFLFIVPFLLWARMWRKDSKRQQSYCPKNSRGIVNYGSVMGYCRTEFSSLLSR